jgi:predicted metalloprotease with PDZ domain
MKTLWATPSVLFVFLLAVPSAAQTPLNYLIRVDDPATQLYHVEAVVPASGAATLVSLPTWTPGYYEIRDYARYTRNFKAYAEDGSPLRWERADKDTWRIHSSRTSSVRVSYDFLADNLSLDGSVLESDFGFFNGTNLFVFPESGYDHPARVRFELPEGWRVATELSDTDEPGVYAAADFHELVDNPTFVGRFAIDSVQADGRWTRLAVYPADVMSGRAWEITLDALQRIADYSHDLFGAPPYDRYTTFVYAYSGPARSSGGLEHANSHLDIVAASGFSNPNQSGVPLGLLSHEYYHAWNVKRIRPAEMWPYDYQREQYSPLLWISEGFTSYYGPLILTRTELRGERAFWSTMQNNIDGVEGEPYQESVEDISLAAWIEPLPIGSGYYYGKGSLIALLLDIKIRSATDNRHSLDDVMYRLYHEHYKRGRGFATEDFLAYVGEHIGVEEVQSFYRDHIDGREPLPYRDVLALAGMTFHVDTIFEPVLGVFMDYGQQGSILIEGVLPESSAAEAGLQSGDQLLRVGGIEVEGEGWADRFRRTYADSLGTPFTVEVLRAGERVTGQSQIRTRARFEYGLEPDPNAGAAEVAVRNGIVQGQTR